MWSCGVFKKEREFVELFIYLFFKTKMPLLAGTRGFVPGARGREETGRRTCLTLVVEGLYSWR